MVVRSSRPSLLHRHFCCEARAVQGSMAEDVLPASLLLAVFSKTDAADCARATCVNRHWRSIGSDDSVWLGHCREEFGVSTPVDPTGRPCCSFKETYEAWYNEFNRYPVGLVSRTKKCWDDLRAFLRSKYPAVAESLGTLASEADIVNAERSLGWSLPAAVRLIYRFCNGQEILDEHTSSDVDHRYVGLLGGYYFYHHFVNVQLLPLKQVVRLTQRLIPQFRLPAVSKRIVIAASCNVNKFFFLDCTDGMVYVGTKNLLRSGEMIPCAPPSNNKVADGMLRWLEEYRDRLLSGMYKVRDDEGIHSISLFPEKEPSCTEAVTCGVQVRCSAVFVPELSTLVGEEDKYLFSYCVRMRLLPVRGLFFSQCQLARRHWIIRSDDVIVDEVRGEAVVGMFPLLKAGGDVFVYESCSSQVSSSGSIEGDFVFVPGSLIRQEGPEFCAKAAPFPLESECLQLIKSCKSLSMAEHVHARIRQQMFNPDCDAFMSNMLIQMYGRCGSAGHARHVFDAMCPKNVFSWALMLSAYAQGGHLEEAKRVFDAMPEWNLVSWTAMLDAYAQKGHLQEAKLVFHGMQERDLVSWTALLSAYARNGHLEDAKNVFDAMQEWNLVSWNAMLSAYAQKGHLEKAKRMFDGMPERNLVSWNAMLTAFAQNGHLEEAKHLFDGMPERDVVSWNAVLAALAQQGHLEEARKVFDRMKERNLISWTTMLSAYAKNRHLEEAKHVFDRMPERDVFSSSAMLTANAQNGHLEEAKHVFDGMQERDLVSWSAMLAGYSQNGHLDEAKQVFDQLQEWDLVSWNAMLSAYAQNGHLEEAKYIFEGMKERSLVSWNAMLTAYAQNGHPEKAKHVFDEMQELNVVSWNAMLTAYAQSGHLEEAKYVFDGMQERNLISCNAMLAAYARNGHLEEAKHVLFGMQERDSTSWTTMVAAYAQNGHLLQAKHVFDGMQEHNAISSNAMLAAYAQNGQPNDAIELFHTLNMSTGMHEDDVSFVCILLACSHAGQADAGRCYFVSMSRDYGISPTKQHYCCMVNLLGRAGHLEDAEDLIANMPFVPDALDWTCLLGACRGHADVERGGRAAHHALDLSPRNAAAYVLLANIYKDYGLIQSEDLN